MNVQFAKPAALFAAVALSLGLSACGGGDDPVVAAVPAAVASVSGTIAVGNPMANGAVSMQCATGAVVTGTADANGAFTVRLGGGQTFPCFITATGGSPATTLHSIVRAEGNVNVTPLSELIIAAAAGTNAQAWFTANQSTLGTALSALIAKLPAAQAAVIGTLGGSGYTLPAGDLLTMAFKPVDGDAYDDLLESIKTSLANAGKTFDDLVTTVASSGTQTTTVAFTDVITTAEVAAMPQLNSATLAISSGVLKMKTNATSGSPVGAYVGGGNGNKAVLQLAGLAGMKLKDFTGLAMEVKANSSQASGNPYVSLNMMIELDCTAAPLPSNATIAQMRERRRLLTFDTYYKYIQGEPGSVSSTEFKTVTMAPATGGWRISTGVVAGDSDTGVIEQGYEGGNYTQETLLSFKHSDYPNACIVDGVSADGGLFRDTSKSECVSSAGLSGSDAASCGRAHSGVFLFLGSSGNLLNGDWDVRKVTINQRTFTFK